MGAEQDIVEEASPENTPARGKPMGTRRTRRSSQTRKVAPALDNAKQVTPKVADAVTVKKTMAANSKVLFSLSGNDNFSSPALKAALLKSKSEAEEAEEAEDAE